MNTRAFTLALIIAFIAMYMVYSYVEGEKAIYKQKYGQEIPVVIAQVDIEELELIDDSKVRVTTVPQQFVAPGAFKNVKEIENTVATMPILKGEQVTKPRVTYPGMNTGLSRQVSPGRRAIAIQVSDRQAVGKLIKPGDRVDVIGAVNYAGGRRDLAKTMTILQDVLVLSTGKNISNAIPLIGIKVPKVVKTQNLNVYSDYNTVTLELSPFEAQKMIFMLENSGTLPYLTLRNNNDKELERIKPIRIFDILGEDAQEAKAFFQEQYSKDKGGRPSAPPTR